MVIKTLMLPLIFDALHRVEKHGTIETTHRIPRRIFPLPPVIKGQQPAVISSEATHAILFAAESTPARPITKLALRFLAVTVVMS